MRITILLFAAILPAFCANALVVNSRVAEVTVYSDRARVTRIAEVSLPEGESIVQFTGLPANLDESSVQAAGESGGAVKIEGLEIRKKFSEQTVDETVLKLQQELQTIDDQTQKLSCEANDLNDRRSFLQQLREGLSRDLGKDAKTAPMSVAQMKSVYDFYGNEIKTLTERTRSIELEKRAMQPKRTKLQNELDRLLAGGQTMQREVLVSVHSSAATPATLQVSYVMTGASWEPVYDARARIDASRMDLGYYAFVRQSTGEDWKDVKLTLSTARPNVGARMAELDPWWLNAGVIHTVAATVCYERKRDQKKSGLLNYSELSPSDAGYEYREEKDKEEMPMEQTAATLDSHGVSAVFRVKLPATIPSDGEPHRSLIATQQFNGKLDYVTTPKLMQSAFLKAHLVNSTDIPIIGGQVNLFLEDDFIGKSRINTIAPTAEFDFYLGVDDGIKVTRKELADRTETTGLISKSTLVTRKYEIVVENFKKMAQTITVYDQIPVSQNASIKVVGAKYSETPKSVEKDTGKVTWEVPLKPGEKKKITLEFQVERPVGSVIAGL